MICVRQIFYFLLNQRCYFLQPGCNVMPIKSRKAFSFESACISMLFNRPSVHDNTLSVFIENSSMWKRSWRWIKTKTHTCGRSKTLQARVFIARAQSSTYVATCNSIVWNVLEWTLENAWKLKCTRIDRCVFGDKENAYFWKRISVDRA